MFQNCRLKTDLQFYVNLEFLIDENLNAVCQDYLMNIYWEYQQHIKVTLFFLISDKLKLKKTDLPTLIIENLNTVLPTLILKH